MAELAGEVYIIVTFALEGRVQPSEGAARRIINLRWKDTAADGAIYHVGGFLDLHAPQLSAEQRVRLVQACHTEIARGNGDDLILGRVTKANAPATLKPFFD